MISQLSEDFLAWHSKHNPYVSKVRDLLSIQLSDEPELLIHQATEIEVHNARIGFLVADANGFLDKAKEAYRPEKEAGTEADRRAVLDANVSSYRVVRDKLESMQDAIKQRLILAESLLAYHRQFHDRTINKNNS